MFWGTLLLIVFVLVCLMLVGLILLQDGENAGGGILGSGGSSLFGTSGDNVVVRTTSVLAALFFALALSLAWVYRSETSDDAFLEQLKSEEALEPSIWEETPPAPSETVPLVQ